MPDNYLHRILTTVLMASCAFVAVHAQTLEQLWKNPTNDYRVKTWWFFGYEHTTDAGTYFYDDKTGDN